jgi:hypothetical protein
MWIVKTDMFKLSSDLWQIFSKERMKTCKTEIQRIMTSKERKTSWGMYT